MSLYADDPDAHIDYPVTDANGGTLDWTPTVTVTDAAGTTTEVTGEWQATATTQGDSSTIRTLRVPLTGLTAGVHSLRLLIADDNDVFLGNVHLA